MRRRGPAPAGRRARPPHRRAGARDRCSRRSSGRGRAAAGEAFAAQSEPVAERDGVVTVACASAVWAQELDLLSERVVERLNERLGRPAVRGLRAAGAPAPR